MHLPLKRLSVAELRRTLRAAQSSLDGFSRATAEAGSSDPELGGRCAGAGHGALPASDVKDVSTATSFSTIATARAVWSTAMCMCLPMPRALAKAPQTRPRPLDRTDPSHLIAIGLDARGLPVSLFTVNRWVTGGHWLDTPTTLRWLQTAERWATCPASCRILASGWRASSRCTCR
jgi:hypothetical protein